jgi:hypothetical protein
MAFRVQLKYERLIESKNYGSAQTDEGTTSEGPSEKFAFLENPAVAEAFDSPVSQANRK